MKCLKCGEENRNDAGKCFKCNTPLLWTPDYDLDEFVKQNIKVSKLAILAICLALLGLILIVVGLMSRSTGRTQNAMFSLKGLFFLSSLIIFIIAFVLGIVSMLRIEISGGLKTGTKFSITTILIAVLGSVFLVVMPFLTKVRSNPIQLLCGTNLAGLGKAMLIYANDYDDELPRAGGPNGTWGNSVNYTATNPTNAYGITSSGTGGSATISSSLYLLVKYCDVTPKSFICPKNNRSGDVDVSEFIPSGGFDLVDLWDFGPKPWMHNSYAYHMPYGKYPLRTSDEPGMAVAADRNPWLPSGWPQKSFDSFNPDSNANYGNTPCHQDQGQNVLYLDTHVDFEPKSFCGINQDNIYTSYSGGDIRKGTPPVLGSVPANRTDSLLVNDPIQ